MLGNRREVISEGINTEIVAERVSPVRAIERVEESCGCLKPHVFESKARPVHFIERSQHIDIPAGPAKFARTRPTYLKKSRSTYVQPRVVLTRRAPIVVTKTITSVQQPIVKRLISERVSRHPGHTRVVDTKVDRDVSFNREEEIVSDVGFRNSLTPVGRSEFEIVRNGPRELDILESGRREFDILEPGRREIDILSPGRREIDILEPGRREVDVLEHGRREVDILEPGRRELEFLEPGRREIDILETGRREFDNLDHRRGEIDLVRSNGFEAEVDVLNAGRFGPEIDLVERASPCGCNLNREIIVNERGLHNGGFLEDRLIGRDGLARDAFLGRDGLNGRDGRFGVVEREFV